MMLIDCIVACDSSSAGTCALLRICLTWGTIKESRS
jgi:hypothetical protein